MTPVEATIVALVVAGLVVAAFWGKRPKITGLGMFTKDKKGRLVMVLTPSRKRKRRRR